MDLNEKDLKQIKWLLNKDETYANADARDYHPDYEDLTKFNTERTLLDYVGTKTLETLSADIMDLLDTSIAVYEKNGDYAYGQFDSSWCQLMNNSSYKLSETNDTEKALHSGKWLCHENCWNDSAKEAMKSGKATDIKCVGGIHLYAEPIKANNKIIGCINMGYGNPPQDDESLKELAKKFNLNKQELLKRSQAYKPRVPFIIENAKKRLKTTALLIGQIIENANTKNKLQRSEELLNETGSMAKVGGWELNLQTKKVKWTKTTAEIHEVPEDYIPSLDEAVSFYPKEAKEQITSLVDKALTKGKAYNVTLPFITAKGRKKWVQAIGNPVFKDGKCIRLHGTFQDITETYQAQIKLKESEALLRRTEEIAHVGSWEWDFEVDKVTWSDQLFKIFGRDPKKGTVSYAEHPKVYTPESMKILDEAVQNTIKTGDSYDIDVDIVRPGGEIRRCIAKGHARKNKKGKIIQLYGSFQDITDRKKQEERLKNVIDSAPFPIAIANKEDQDILYWSQSALKQFGHNPDTVEEWFKLAYPNPKYRKEVIERWKPYLDEAAKSKKAINTGEYNITCKDGSVKICEIYANFIPGQLVVTFNNVNKKKETELKIKRINEELAAQNEEYLALNEELHSAVEEIEIAKEDIKESEERFEALHNASFGGIVIHDKGSILECNQGLSEMTGYSYEELIGMDGLLLIAEEKRDEVMKNIDSEYEIPYEAIGQRKNGEKYPLRLEARMIPYKGKKVRVVEFRDITVQKENEKKLNELNTELAAQNEEYESLNEELQQTVEQLYEAKNKAEESDRLKSAFLANMSHEIRTPMNGILGFTNLLKKPGLKGEQQEKYINVIQLSGNRMLETINDIIEISKIEAGDINPVYEKVNINEQLEYFYDFFKPEVDSKGMELSLNKTLEDDKAIITTDTSMFNSILTNLIKNAIKYSDMGSIEFGYNLQKQNELKFYVKDTGIGIAEEKFDVIFDRFMQADIGDTRAAQGSGLGLSICKAYVQILGGRIWLDSETNKGTTFFFTLPYSQPEKE